MNERATLATLAPITLSSVAGGQVERQFQEELARVQATLADPQKAGPCKITVTLDFLPEEDSVNFCRLASSVACKLPARKSRRVLTISGGEILEDVTSLDARQPGLFPVHETEENR